MAKMKKYKPLILPGNNVELKDFISKNKIQLMENVLSSIEHALVKNLPNIAVFSFKNSDFIITLSKDTFKENVDMIYDYYIKEEKYEFCDRVKNINKLLEKTPIYEK